MREYHCTTGGVRERHLTTDAVRECYVTTLSVTEREPFYNYNESPQCPKEVPKAFLSDHSSILWMKFPFPPSLPDSFMCVQLFVGVPLGSSLSHSLSSAYPRSTDVFTHTSVKQWMF